MSVWLCSSASQTHLITEHIHRPAPRTFPRPTASQPGAGGRCAGMNEQVPVGQGDHKVNKKNKTAGCDKGRAESEGDSR